MSEQPFYRPHRSTKDGWFGWFNHAAVEAASRCCQKSGVAVYIALCLAESRSKDYKDRFSISRDKLCAAAGCSVRTLQATLAKLAADKLIEIRSGHRGEKGAPDHANTYRISAYFPEGFSGGGLGCRRGVTSFRRQAKGLSPYSIGHCLNPTRVSLLRAQCARALSLRALDSYRAPVSLSAFLLPPSLPEFSRLD